MSSPKGSVVLNEVVIPIVDITLGKECFILHGRLTAPKTQVYDLRGEGRVFGADGSCIGAVPALAWDQEWHKGLISASPGTELTLSWPWRVTYITSRNAETWRRAEI